MRKMKHDTDTDTINPNTEEGILHEIEETYGRYRRYRYNFERTWYRNILFLLGIQWIIWDETQRIWRKRKLRNWVPTPVTNKFMEGAERLASILSRIEPNWIFAPGSESEADMAAAKMAQSLEGIIAEDNKVEQLRDVVSKWLTYTGNCYLGPSVEKKEQTLPPELSGMSEAGAPEEFEMMQQALGGMSEEYSFYTDVYSPFELYADLSIPLMKDQERVMVVTRKDKEYIKRLWDVDVQEEESSDLGQKYLESIGYISADLGIGDYAYFRDHRIERATVKRLWVRPCEKYPEGMYAVKAGDKLVEGPIPLPKNTSGEPMLNIVQFKFDSIPAAFFARTPMNDIVPKQIQRNKLESLMELISLRMANPVWLIPEGTRMANFSGQPGAILKWSQVGDRSAPPQRIPGEQITESLFKWLEKIDDDIEGIVSTFDALKGKAPYSGAPGVVVDALIEQGLTRFGPALRNITEGWREWMQIELELYKKYPSGDRMTSVGGDNTTWKTNHFNKADIQGSVNVRVESDSSVPRSEYAQSARILTAIQAGLVQMSDPVDMHRVLKKLHLSDLSKTVDEDVISAVKEHEVLLETEPEKLEALDILIKDAQAAGNDAIPPLPIRAKPFIDNDLVHIQKHRSFALSDEGAPFEAILSVHIAQHYMNMGAIASTGQEGEQAKPGIGKDEKETLSGPPPASGPSGQPAQAAGFGGAANNL